MVAALAGCWTGSAAPVEKPPEGPVVVVAPPPSEPPISLLTSFVVVEACPDAKKLDSKLATREIDELVGPCKSIPGGAAHFSATLLPGGRVELASPSGDPAEGIIPTCLVQKAGQLRHKIRLTQSCKFDVKLEQRMTDSPAR